MPDRNPDRLGIEQAVIRHRFFYAPGFWLQCRLSRHKIEFDHDPISQAANVRILAPTITFLLAMLLPSVDAVGQSSGTKSKDKSDESSVDAGPATGVTFSNPVKNRWQVGVKIKGRSRSAKNFFITIPVPTDWPEQTVDLFEENIPTEVRSVEYRELNSGVRQLVATIPTIKANQLLEMTVTFNVTTHQVNAPPNTDTFEIPKRAPKEVKQYLGVSPQISYRNAKLRNKVKELIVEKNTAWDKTETIFDWVRDNIEYRDEEPSDSLTVFRRKSGCGEDLVGLFVAMCRVAKIPARMVWVEGAQYAEFYLVDHSGAGHWFPCNVAGRREFGSYAEPRIIQQKGDNIKVPEKDQRQKFCAEFVKGSGKSKPVVVFVRKLLPAE